MSNDDWRIRVEVEQEPRHGLFQRALSPEADELAQALSGDRLAVSRDGSTIYVYAGSRQQAEHAQAIVAAELQSHGVEARVSAIEHWLAEEDRWDDDPAEPDIEEELLERGYAPWEVRVEAASHREARELAERLERDGYAVERRWRYLIVGVSSRDEATALAQELHGEVEPGGELVYEVLPRNPFAIFGGLGT
jgi:hypothetical protein